MTKDAETILDKLVMDQKVRANQGYPLPALRENARGWLGDDATDALNELIDEGCLEHDDRRFWLTQKGYDLACEGQTLESTQKKIVKHIFQSTAASPKRMGKIEVNRFKEYLSPCVQDHFDEALDGLEEDGIIERDAHGTVALTGRYMNDWEQ